MNTHAFMITYLGETLFTKNIKLINIQTTLLSYFYTVILVDSYVDIICSSVHLNITRSSNKGAYHGVCVVREHVRMEGD